MNGMSPARFAAAMADLPDPGLPIQPPPVPPAPTLLASGSIQSREELDVLAALARRENAEYRFRAITRRYKRRLCRFALCPRLVYGHGLCRTHWREGHAMLARARRQMDAGRYGVRSAA